ncbi:hypothetical protein [Nocardia testacea]|uniref:hypothetical protein n=1 Tax=Nocardia testacea TaxID=248551 RepID=UPI0033E223F0
MATFASGESAIHEARRVLDALDRARTRGSGAVQLDGQMLEKRSPPGPRPGG